MLNEICFLATFSNYGERPKYCIKDLNVIVGKGKYLNFDTIFQRKQGKYFEIDLSHSPRERGNLYTLHDDSDKVPFLARGPHPGEGR